MTWTLDTPGNHINVIFFFLYLLFLCTFSQIPPFVNVLIFSVPSVAPSGLRVSTLQFTELKVQWNPIPQHSVNGRLLGYVVEYQEYPYRWYNTRRRVNASGPDVHMLVLSGLKAAHSYRVWVEAFTRLGTGPKSSPHHVTTGKLAKSTWRTWRQKVQNWISTTSRSRLVP